MITRKILKMLPSVSFNNSFPLSHFRVRLKLPLRTLAAALVATSRNVLITLQLRQLSALFADPAKLGGLRHHLP